MGFNRSLIRILAPKRSKSQTAHHRICGSWMNFVESWFHICKSLLFLTLDLAPLIRFIHAGSWHNVLFCFPISDTILSYASLVRLYIPAVLLDNILCLFFCFVFYTCFFSIVLQSHKNMCSPSDFAFTVAILAQATSTQIIQHLINLISSPLQYGAFS